MISSNYSKQVLQQYLRYQTCPERPCREDYVFFSLTHGPEDDSSHYDDASLCLSLSLEISSWFPYVFFALAWLFSLKFYFVYFV